MEVQGRRLLFVLQKTHGGPVCVSFSLNIKDYLYTNDTLLNLGLPLVLLHIKVVKNEITFTSELVFTFRKLSLSSMFFFLSCE